MTEHDAREVTTERRPGMDQLLLHAQAWWDAQRFDQPVWQVATWRDQYDSSPRLATLLERLTESLAKGSSAVLA
jgi:hypothetical protein